MSVQTILLQVYTLTNNAHIIIISGKPSLLYDETNPDWAPSLNLGGAPEPESTSLARYERVQQRREKRRRFDVCEGLHSFAEVSLLA